MIIACTAHAVLPTQSVNANACYCYRGYQGVNDAVCNGYHSNTRCWTGILNTCRSSISAPALSSYPTWNNQLHLLAWFYQHRWIGLPPIQPRHLQDCQRQHKLHCMPCQQLLSSRFHHPHSLPAG